MAEPLTREDLDEKFDRFADTVQRGFNDARELTALRAKYERLEERVAQLELART